MVSLGQIAYEAYGKAGNWLTFDGRVMPSWEALSQDTQFRWNIAAETIAELVRTEDK